MPIGWAALAESRPTLQAAHPVLFVNPVSGGGKAQEHHLVRECRARGIAPIDFQPGDDLSALVSAEVSAGADLIGIARGDGSQAVVAAVAAEHDIPFVCVPAGTRNHFAADIGLDRHDVLGALDAFFDGRERRIDVAAVNGRVYVNTASMGLYARIIQSPRYRDAKLKTVAEMLPDLLGPGTEPKWSAAHLLLVSNNPYELLNLGGQGARKKMDSGRLGIVAALILDPRAVADLVAAEKAGALQRFPPLSEWTTPARLMSILMDPSKSHLMAKPWSWIHPCSSSPGRAPCGFGSPESLTFRVADAPAR